MYIIYALFVVIVAVIVASFFININDDMEGGYEYFDKRFTHSGTSVPIFSYFFLYHFYYYPVQKQMIHTNKGRAGFKATAFAILVSTLMALAMSIFIAESVADNTPAGKKQPDIAGYIYLYSTRPFVWVYKVLVCLNLVGHIPMDFAIGKEYLLIMIAERDTHVIEKTVHKARNPIGDNFQDARGTLYSMRVSRNLNKISVVLFTVVFLVAAVLILTYKNLYSGFFVLSEINFAYCSPIIQYMYPFYFFYATLSYFE